MLIDQKVMPYPFNKLNEIVRSSKYTKLLDMIIKNIFSVNEKKNFWRKAALNDKKEQKPQSERSPEWLADYQKNKLGTQQKQSGGEHQGLCILYGILLMYIEVPILV